MIRKGNSGQALLIILLIMAVILTISLAVVSRSITDLKVSRQEEESARVFSVAETGIEQAMLNPAVGLNDTINGVNYQVTCSPEGNQRSFDFGGAKFAQGAIQTLWLVGHTGEDPDPSVTPYTGSNLALFWGNQGQANDATAPALEATLYYRDGGVFKVARYAFDATSRGGFASASYDSSRLYPFQATINSLPGGVPYALRLKLIYNVAEVALKVEGNAVFPAQGDCCDSTAVRVESGVTRKVRQCRFYKAPPGIFDYVLFSGGDISK